MENLQRKIRDEARNLLAKGSVDLIIGFEEGTMPLRASPVFIHSQHDVEKLVWNCFCENNLATYLAKVGSSKVAVFAKGCDSRSIVALIVEGQIKREQIVVIGIPCQGMVDRRKIEKGVGGQILGAKEKNNEVLVKGDDFEKVFEKEDNLYPSCRNCRHRNPSIWDILIGEKIEENSEIAEYAEINEYEKKSINERWEYFSRETGECIRCYACRQACPMCYCEECFVDSSYPKWIEKGLDPSDLALWHVMRAYHQTGRCVDCGSCERACPMEIDLRFLTKKINKEVKDHFDFETGMDMKVSPPLAVFSADDRQDFIDSGQEGTGKSQG